MARASWSPAGLLFAAPVKELSPYVLAPQAIRAALAQLPPNLAAGPAAVLNVGAAVDGACIILPPTWQALGVPHSSGPPADVGLNAQGGSAGSEGFGGFPVSLIGTGWAVGLQPPNAAEGGGETAGGGAGPLAPSSDR
jgi:hypothetical protein